jgi:hypothetical protein
LNRDTAQVREAANPESLTFNFHRFNIVVAYSEESTQAAWLRFEQGTAGALTLRLTPVATSPLQPCLYKKTHCPAHADK